jgi:hypothetical protein
MSLYSGVDFDDEYMPFYEENKPMIKVTRLLTDITLLSLSTSAKMKSFINDFLKD